MIDQLDTTIQNLIQRDPHLEKVEVSFSAPSGEWASRAVNRPTLNFFLYDVRENAPLRRHQWQKAASGIEPPRNGSSNGQNGDGTEANTDSTTMATMRRHPLMLDCFYMVSAWSSTDEHMRPLEEHRLLSRCLLALARFPILNPDFAVKMAREVIKADDVKTKAKGEELVYIEQKSAGRKVSRAVFEQRDWLADPDMNPVVRIEHEVRTRLAHHDVLINPAEVWGSLENQMKAAFSYVVTLPMDPWSSLSEEVGEVGAITFNNPPPQPRTEGDKLPYVKPKANPQQRRSIVGGLIRKIVEKDERDEHGTIKTGTEQQPYADLEVWIEEKGLRVTTNESGRFTFRSIPPREDPTKPYTVKVCIPQDPKPLKEDDTTLPTNRTDEPLWSGKLLIPSDTSKAIQPLVIELVEKSGFVYKIDPQGSTDTAQTEKDVADPYSGLDVWIKEKKLGVQTDKDGYFTLHGLPTDTYTLEIYRPQSPHPATNKEIILPSERPGDLLKVVPIEITSDAQPETFTVEIEEVQEESSDGGQALSE